MHKISGMLLAVLLASSLGARVADRAERYVGADQPKDCSSFVEQVFRHEGVRVSGDVAALHARARAARALRRTPRRGDLVFFRNTYDRNRDGQLHDGLTHVGIVDHVHKDGTVTFVHRARTGVTRSALDPRHRHVHRDGRGRVRNDYLRRQPPALSGELLVDFADVQKLSRPP